MSANEDGSNGDLEGHRWLSGGSSSTIVPNESDIEALNSLRDSGIELENSEYSSGQDDRTPQKESEPADGSVDIAGFKTLQSLLTSSLFADYLHYRAIRTHEFPDLEARVHRFCMDHKALSFICTALDMTTRLLVWIAVFGTLVAVIGATVYRAFLSEIFPIN